MLEAQEVEELRTEVHGVGVVHTIMLRLPIRQETLRTPLQEVEAEHPAEEHVGQEVTHPLRSKIPLSSILLPDKPHPLQPPALISRLQAPLPHNHQTQTADWLEN